MKKGEQHIIHIRSKDGQRLNDDYNTHFRVNLTSPILCKLEDTIKATIASVEIPHSFFCISKVLKNNTIYWRDIDGDSLYLLPEQNYTIPSLVKILNSNTPFLFSYNEFSNRMTISNLTENDLTILWSKSGCRDLLGFIGEADNLLLPNDYMSPMGIVDLATVHSIMIKSDLASGFTQSTRAGQSSTLQKIAVDVEPWSIIYLKEGSHRTTSTISKSNINIIEFRLTDQNDNLIDLNGINFEFTLIIDIEYAIENSIPSGNILPNSSQDTSGNSIGNSSGNSIQNVSEDRRASIQPMGNVAQGENNDEDSEVPLSDVVEETIMDIILKNNYIKI